MNWKTNMSFVYIQTDPKLWAVGHYAPDGRFVLEGHYGSPGEAAARTMHLNGSFGQPGQEKDIAEMARVVAGSAWSVRDATLAGAEAPSTKALRTYCQDLAGMVWTLASAVLAHVEQTDSAANATRQDQASGTGRGDAVEWLLSRHPEVKSLISRIPEVTIGEDHVDLDVVVGTLASADRGDDTAGTRTLGHMSSGEQTQVRLLAALACLQGPPSDDDINLPPRSFLSDWCTAWKTMDTQT